MTEPISISGELTPDPQVCKFITNRNLVDEWVIIFRGAEEACGSPLVENLFQVDGISSVKVAGSTITLSKTRPEPWPEIARELVPVIKKTLTDHEHPISAEAIEAVKNQPMDDMAGTIESLFEHHINPALASHGGFVRLVKVEERDVYVEMGGGCQGCSSSQATLQQGIESAIRDVAPQVNQIIDATDHAAGANPYYN